MSNLISIRVTDEQAELLEDLANRFSCTPSAFVKKSLDFILEDREFIEKHFSHRNNFIRAKGDFLSEIGACPFYGVGRNTFYSFGNGEKKCFLFSTSRTISKNESPIVTLDGKKISEFIEICRQTETVGYITIRFRISKMDEWRFFLSPISGLNSSPFSKSSSTGNYFFHLKRVLSTEILNNLDMLKKEMEDRL